MNLHNLCKIKLFIVWKIHRSVPQSTSVDHAFDKAAPHQSATVSCSSLCSAYMNASRILVLEYLNSINPQESCVFVMFGTGFHALQPTLSDAVLKCHKIFLLVLLQEISTATPEINPKYFPSCHPCVFVLIG